MNRISLYQVIIILCITMNVSCKKAEETIIPPNPNIPTTITLEASVPAIIYSNKEIILDALPTTKLNGTRSLKFLWSCTNFPVGKKPAIINPESASTAVLNIVTGKYTFLLNVTDNYGNTATGSYDVRVLKDTLSGPPAKPKLLDVTVVLPDPITLGANFYDSNPVGRVLNFSWSIIEQPLGSTPFVSGSTFSYVTVQNCIPGKYLLKLEIINELGLTSADTVEATVLPDPLSGSTRIYDNLKWVVRGNYYDEILAVVVNDTISFNARDRLNTEVSLWDFQNQTWLAPNSFTWGGAGNNIEVYNSSNLLEITEGKPARVKVYFK